MRICYIWVENFKNLNDFGINLRNDFKFRYDSETHKLSRCKQAELPPELLGDNILDATAILGINGAGKTNALELTCLSLKSSERIKTPSIIVYESRGKLCYINNTNNEINTDFPAQRRDDHKDLKDLTVIYFSNVFDENQLDLGKYVQDISTNFKHNRKKTIFEKKEPGSDIATQIRFIRSSQFPKIKIDTPKTFELRIDRSVRATNNDRIHNTNGLISKISTIQNMLRKRTWVTEAQLAAIAIQGLVLYQVLAEHRENKSLTQQIDSALYNPGHEDLTMREALQVARDYFISNKNVTLGGYDGDISRLIDIVIALEFHLGSMNIRIDDSIKSSRYTFTLDFNNNQQSPYLELSEIIGIIKSGSMNWTGVSSGQKAYLNMFSAIWSTLSKVGKAKNNSGTLLCIDEADLYLHPKWQVEFMERLITCLPELSEQKIQIIITTHSPILVSDLPSQCLVTLPSPLSQNGPELPTDALKTFGANLFDIYAYTFGLKGQRSGNISSKYISKILSILDSDDITPQELVKLQQAASIIDDELITSHLIKRIYSQ